MTKVSGFFCGPHIYEYDGWLFEWHSYCGPWPLRKNGELRKRAGKSFWNMIARFQKLPERETVRFRVITGGCRSFTVNTE